MTTFIQDFNKWRNNQISTNFSSYSSVDVKTLTAEKFVGLTTNQDVTDSTTNVTSKQDVVKIEADSYLINVILYHLSALGLKALDVDKPTLSTEILNTFQNDTGFSTSLEKYASLWLLSSIHQQNKETKYYSRVKIEAVEKDFKELQCSKPITTVTMRLTFLATAKKCPDFLPYMYNSKTLISKVQSYYLEKDFKKNWVATTYAAIKDKINDSTFNDNVRFTELKSKLDILDPSFNLSSTVLNTYYSELFVLLGSRKSIQNNPVIQNLWTKVTQDAIHKIASMPTHPWYQSIITTKDLFKGNIALMAKQVSRALFKMNFDMNALAIKGADPKHVFSFDSMRFVQEMRKKGLEAEGFKKLKADKNLHRFVSGVFILCSAASIYAGFKSYDKLNSAEKVILWVNTVVTGVDTMVSLVEATKSGYDAYVWIGTRISKLTKPKFSAIRPAGAAENVSKWAKYTKLNYVLKYITAALIVVGMAFTVYDMVTSIQNQDWGMLALSVVEFAVEFGILVLTFMTATSWSGPVCLILTGVLIVIGIIKMFWDTIKKVFHDIGRFFDTLFNGDPAVNYVNSTEEKYHYTTKELSKAILEQLEKYAKEHPEYKKTVEILKKTLFYGV